MSYESSKISASNTLPREELNESVHFTDIPLEIEKKKKPKRILHFSDGILEEYSSEDEVDLNKNEPVKPDNAIVSTKEMTWSVYLWYLALTLGTKTLSVCDYLGENLAHFFGITTPKYQYEIDEYQRIIQEEEEMEREEREQNAGWISAMESDTRVTDDVPVLSVKFGPAVTSFNNDLPRVESTRIERY